MGRPSYKRDRPSAVRRAPGPAAPARVPRAHPGRGVRGQPARSAGSSAGIACSRSAIRRTTSRRPRAASPPAPRAKAARRRRWPTTCCCERDGKEMLYLPVTNFAAGNLDVVREMIAAPNTLIGLGDGGAHVGIMCDATATSYTLTHWTRDRGRGSLFPVAWAHQAADRGQCRGDRAERSRRAEGRDEGRHQHPRLRQHAAAPARRSSTTCRPAASGWSSAPTASMRRSCRVPWCTGTASRPRRCRGGWFAARARLRSAPHKYHSGLPGPGCPRLLIKKSATHSRDALNCASTCRHERA